MTISGKAARNGSPTIDVVAEASGIAAGAAGVVVSAATIAISGVGAAREAAGRGTMEVGAEAGTTTATPVPVTCRHRKTSP